MKEDFMFIYNNFMNYNKKMEIESFKKQHQMLMERYITAYFSNHCREIENQNYEMEDEQIEDQNDEMRVEQIEDNNEEFIEINEHINKTTKIKDYKNIEKQLRESILERPIMNTYNENIPRFDSIRNCLLEIKN